MRRDAQPPSPRLAGADLRELAHLTDESIAILRHLSIEYRTRWLHELHAAHAQRTAVASAQLKSQLAEGIDAWRSPATGQSDEIQRT